MAGFTPMIKARNLGKRLGLNNLYIKNDSVNPSYSFKDRVVSVAATKAIEFGFETLACASTGNLACSVAAHAARAGIRSVVFIPSDLERGKVIGAAVYGPTMVAVDGTYDEVNRLCSEVGDNYPWAFVNINMRPYYAEGSKTLGYEVAEQLGWRLPDHVVVPSASGAMFTKIWKGFNELACLGLLDGVDAMSFGADQNTVHHPAVTTRMHMAQAAGCSPHRQRPGRTGQTHVRPVRPDSIAKSLAIGNPADGIYAVQGHPATPRAAATARSPKSEIVDGIKPLGRDRGHLHRDRRRCRRLRRSRTWPSPGPSAPTSWPSPTSPATASRPRKPSRKWSTPWPSSPPSAPLRKPSPAAPQWAPNLVSPWTSEVSARWTVEESGSLFRVSWSKNR